MSSLIVAFPVFLYMSWLVGREIAADPNKRHSKVRRWLTYITLFVAAGVVIGDVVTLVYNLLGGEITIRFMLKVLVVAFIAGSVSGITSPTSGARNEKPFVVIVVLVVLGALGGGFYLVGPPAEERARRLDDAARSDLQRLRLAADLYWTRNRRLPVSLDELAKEAGTDIYSRDPESGEPYTYVVKA